MCFFYYTTDETDQLKSWVKYVDSKAYSVLCKVQTVRLSSNLETTVVHAFKSHANGNNFWVGSSASSQSKTMLYGKYTAFIPISRQHKKTDSQNQNICCCFLYQDASVSSISFNTHTRLL